MPVSSATPVELPAALASRFEKLSVLGQGGAGVVMKCRDLMIGREVAIKILVAGLADQTQLLKGEATNLAKLEHERVVRLYEFGVADGAAYLVMEYVRGETLWKRLARDRPPLLEALGTGIELAEGLAAAHALAIAHGDVKPMNVFLDPAGRVKIADFGLARPVQDAGEAGARKGEVLGTPGYMAPEQVDGMPLTPASDVYAAGVVLHEMLTGQRLFTGRTSLSIMTQQVRGPEVRPRDVNPGVPGGLDELVMRCLHRDPGHRPAATELAVGLREWQDRLVKAARQPASAGFPAHPYKFLHHFEPDDAVIFFGRESEVAELAGLVTAPGVRLLLVFAPCGTGKSSLLRAGLLPALDRKVYDPVIISAGADPAHALAEAIEKNRDSGRTPVVILDQLEELYTLNPPDAPEIPRFLELASRLVEDQEQPVKLVLSFRTEFRGRLFALERRLAKHTQSYLVGEMREIGLAAAIEGPSAIESYGFGYEPGFARQLAADIVQTVAQRGETAPPILQIVCRQLYDHARAQGHKLIGPGLYQKALGGARGALAAYVRERLDGPGYGVHGKLAQQMLRALTVREAGGERFARAREEEDLLAFPDRDAARLVLEELIADRLVVREDAGKKGWTIRLASEIICPLVDEWADDASETERAARLLARASRQWTENGRRAEDLLSGGGLSMVERQLKHLRSLSNEDLALVEASRAARQTRHLSWAALAAAVVAMISGTLWLAFFRPGRADIKSNPPGAEVVDAAGQPLGTTPLSWSAQPGVYQLTLRKSQYQDLALTVRVPAGGEATYSPVLPYPYGVLTLASDPAGVGCAVVSAAGATVLTTTTPFHAELPTGQYSIRLSGPGVVAQELTGVALGENREPAERMVRLEKDTGWLQVDTADAGAELLIKDAATGRLAATATLPMAARELPAGAYRLEVFMPDRHAQELSVSLTRGTTSLVSAQPAAVKVLWTRPPPRPFATHAGFDHDKDGVPDIAVMDKDMRFRVVSGRSGADLVTSADPPKMMLEGRVTTWPELITVEKCETIQLADLDGDGKAEVVLALDSGRVLGLDPVSARAKFTGKYQSTSISWLPILRDLDGDGAADVTAISGGKLVARSGKTSADLWSVPGGQDPSVYALVDGLLAGRPLAVVVSMYGSVAGYDPRDGSQKWAWDPPMAENNGEAHVAVGDLDGDGKDDVAACGRRGVVVVSGATGKMLWSKAGLRPMDIEVAQLRKGPGRQVVVGGQESLTAFDGKTGRELWALRNPVWFDDLHIRDLDGDGLDDVIAKRRSNRIDVYRGTDAKLLRILGNAPDIRYQIHFGDLDGDGTQDMVYLDARRGFVAASGAKEQPVWSFKAPGTVVPAPAAADLDGDGEPDVVACVNADPTSWLVAISGRDQRVLWQEAYESRAFPYMVGNPCLLLSDVTADGTCDAVVVDEKNRLRVHDGKTGKTVWSRTGKDLVPVIGAQELDAGKHGRALLCRSLNRAHPDGPMRLYAIDGRTGKELWSSTGVPPLFGASAMCVEPGRPRPDVLAMVLTPRAGSPMMSARGVEVAVLDAETGEVRRVIGPVITHRRPIALAAADFNGDGYDDPVIAIARLSLSARDGKTGAELWSMPAPDDRTPPGMDPVDDQLALADLDSDGVTDVVCVGLAGNAVAVSGKTGKPLWTGSMKQRLVSRVTLAHLDGSDVPHVTAADSFLDVVGLSGRDGRDMSFNLPTAPQVPALLVDPADPLPYHGEISLRRVTKRHAPSPRARVLLTGRDHVLRLIPLKALPFRR